MAEYNSLLFNGVKEHAYYVISLILSERLPNYCEHVRDWVNLPEAETTKRIVEYLSICKKTEDLEVIKERLEIKDLNYEAYKKFSHDIEFLMLTLRTIADDDFEFRNTINSQLYSGTLADVIKKLLTKEKIQGRGNNSFKNQ